MGFQVTLVPEAWESIRKEEEEKEGEEEEGV